jgi:hypothetical protein
VLHVAFLNWLWEALRWTWHDPDGYNFISGPLADITLLGGAYAILRRHNCAVKGCFRIGRHPVAGTDHIVCRKHHPHDSPSAEQVLAEHAASKHREALTAAGAATTAAEVAATSAGGAPAPPPGEPLPRDPEPT